jgi:hypothetical protein
MNRSHGHLESKSQKGGKLLQLPPFDSLTFRLFDPLNRFLHKKRHIQ